MRRTWGTAYEITRFHNALIVMERSLKDEDLFPFAFMRMHREISSRGMLTGFTYVDPVPMRISLPRLLNVLHETGHPGSAGSPGSHKLS
jgi:hypothetical protein